MFFLKIILAAQVLQKHECLGALSEITISSKPEGILIFFHPPNKIQKIDFFSNISVFIISIQNPYSDS